MLLDDPGSPAAGPAHRPGPGGMPLPAWCRSVARLSRIVIPSCVVPVALVGALVTPLWAVLGLGPVLGLTSVAAVLGVDPSGPVGPGRRRSAVLLGAAGVLAVPFASGLGLLGDVGSAVVLVLLVLAPFPAAEWLSRLAVDGEPEGVLDELPADVSRLSTDQLLDAWRATDRVMAGRPDTRRRAVSLRAALLDELTRRDPAGVARWLQAGDPLPDRHIRADLSG